MLCLVEKGEKRDTFRVPVQEGWQIMHTRDFCRLFDLECVSAISEQCCDDVTKPDDWLCVVYQVQHGPCRSGCLGGLTYHAGRRRDCLPTKNVQIAAFNFHVDQPNISSGVQVQAKHVPCLYIYACARTRPPDSKNCPPRPSVARPPLPPSVNGPGTEQVRDEARATNDPARGGLGGLALAEENGQLAPQGGGGGDYYGSARGGGPHKRPRVDWDARDRR